MTEIEVFPWVSESQPFEKSILSYIQSFAAQSIIIFYNIIMNQPQYNNNNYNNNYQKQGSQQRQYYNDENQNQNYSRQPSLMNPNNFNFFNDEKKYASYKQSPIGSNYQQQNYGNKNQQQQQWQGEYDQELPFYNEKTQTSNHQNKNSSKNRSPANYQQTPHSYQSQVVDSYGEEIVHNPYEQNELVYQQLQNEGFEAVAVGSGHQSKLPSEYYYDEVDPNQYTQSWGKKMASVEPSRQPSIKQQSSKHESQHQKSIQSEKQSSNHIQQQQQPSKEHQRMIDYQMIIDQAKPQSTKHQSEHHESVKQSVKQQNSGGIEFIVVEKQPSQKKLSEHQRSQSEKIIANSVKQQISNKDIPSQKSQFDEKKELARILQQSQAIMQASEEHKLPIEETLKRQQSYFKESLKLIQMTKQTSIAFVIEQFLNSYTQQLNQILETQKLLQDEQPQEQEEKIPKKKVLFTIRDKNNQIVNGNNSEGQYLSHVNSAPTIHINKRQVSHLEIPIATLKMYQKEEFLLKAKSDPKSLEDLQLLRRETSIMSALGKPPLRPFAGKRRFITTPMSSIGAMSIYNLAKDELSTSKISQEEHVANLRGRLPPGPDSRNENRVPHNKLWLRHTEKTALNGQIQDQYAHLLKYEKKAFQQHVNNSFDRHLNQKERLKILDNTHVFSVSTASVKPPSRESQVQADPGGNGIQRLKQMYGDFLQEQDDQFAKGLGPGQLVGAADLLLNKVYANPMLRGTQIVTDPVFQAYLDRNKLREKVPRNQKKPILKPPQGPITEDPDTVLVLEPTYQYDKERFGDMVKPEEGFQIGLTEEQFDKEKERYLQHTTFLMQQKNVGYEIQTNALLKRGNDLDIQMREMMRAKELNMMVAQAMRLKEDDESKIEEVKDAAERIREDLKEAARKQEEAVEKNEKNMQKAKEANAQVVEGEEIEKPEIMPEIEDIIDLTSLRQRMEYIEKCEPLKKSWTRDTLMLNLQQIIADVKEVIHIRTLPNQLEYRPKEAQQSDLVMMSLKPEEKLKSALEKKLFLVKRLREKIVFRLKAAEEQFVHLKRELDYTFRVLDERPLEELILHYFPKNESLAPEDFPKGQPKLKSSDREEVVNFLVKIREKGSPTKGGDQVNLPGMTDKTQGTTPNEVLQDQKLQDFEQMKKTLALNQRLMDTSDNTDALLSAYAGGSEHQVPSREPKKHMLFYQRNGGAHTMDEDQKMAALKILNVSRRKKGNVKVDGIVYDANNPEGGPNGQLSKIEEGHENEQEEEEEDELEPETVKDALELIKKKNLNLIRKLAPDMPTQVATKIQGRTLASVGEHGKNKPPERYMYQFLARQRVEHNLRAQKAIEGKKMQITVDKSTPSLFTKDTQIKNVVEIQSKVDRHSPVKVDHSPKKSLRFESASIYTINDRTGDDQSQLFTPKTNQFTQRGITDRNSISEQEETGRENKRRKHPLKMAAKLSNQQLT